jgi:hypothetical protein
VSVCMGPPSCLSVRFSQGLLLSSKPLSQDFSLGIPCLILRRQYLKREGCPVQCHTLTMGCGSLVALLLTVDRASVEPQITRAQTLL